MELRVFNQGKHLITSPLHEGIHIGRGGIAAFKLADADQRRSHKQFHLEVLVGDEAVQEWFKGDKFGDYQLASRAWDRIRARTPKGEKVKYTTESIHAETLAMLREWAGALVLTSPPEGEPEEVVE